MPTQLFYHKQAYLSRVRVAPMHTRIYSSIATKYRVLRIVTQNPTKMDNWKVYNIAVIDEDGNESKVKCLFEGPKDACMEFCHRWDLSDTVEVCLEGKDEFGMPCTLESITPDRVDAITVLVEDAYVIWNEPDNYPTGWRDNNWLPLPWVPKPRRYSHMTSVRKPGGPVYTGIWAVGEGKSFVLDYVEHCAGHPSQYARIEMRIPIGRKVTLHRKRG